MNIPIKSQHLKYGVFGAGLLSALLRFFLYTTGTDGKGLLVRGHWAAVALWVLTAAVLAVLLLRCRTITGPQLYKHSFPTSTSGGIGCLLGAAGFALNFLAHWPQSFALSELLVPAVNLLSAVSLLWVGICRLYRLKPLFLFHAMVCVGFALQMVGQYRDWSADPQIHNYLFYMSAHVGLMLTAYHFAAFDADMGAHRTLWFLGLFSAYLCLVCLYGTEESLFMGLCALWVLTNLPRLEAPARRERPRMVFEDEPREEV